jgi:hypothetical protein
MRNYMKDFGMAARLPEARQNGQALVDPALALLAHYGIPL